jgi:parallel beta-helix repeat protein
VVVSAALLSIGVPGVASAAGGTTYHVDGSSSACSDTTGTGSAAAPFCTLAKGVGAATTAGDTVLVGPGSYAGHVFLRASGTAGNPITVRSATPRQAVIDGALKPGTGLTLSGVSWVVVEGFTIRGTSSHGLAVYNGNHVTLSNNEVSHAGKPEKGLTANGILLSGVQESSVTNNTVRDNTEDGIALNTSSANATPPSVQTTGVQVTGNTSDTNARGWTRAATGINVTGSNNVVRGNRTTGNEDSGIFVHAASLSAAPARGNTVLSNTVWANGDHGVDAWAAPATAVLGNAVYGNTTSGINVENSSTAARVVNNISAGNGIDSPRRKGQIRVDESSAPDTVVDTNLVHLAVPGTVYTWGKVQYSSLAAFRQAVSGQEGHGLEADPRWSNPAGGAFALTPGSPAIDTADTAVAGWPSTDAAGVSPYDDRGPLEFVPPPRPPAAPDPLSITPSVLSPGAVRQPVTITGTDFPPAAVPSVPDVQLDEVTVNHNGTVITALASVPASAARGPRDLTVTNPATGGSGTCGGCVKLAAVPSVPAAALVSERDRALRVSWGAPDDDGGAAVTGYEVTARTSDGTVASSTTIAPDGPLQTTLTGLQNGVAYAVEVVAQSAAGAGEPARGAGTPFGQPLPPAVVEAVAGDTTAAVSWAGARPNGRPIVGYRVTASSRGLPSVVRPVPAGARRLVVDGLANFRAYTFTVAALNDVGPGAPSAATPAVTPRLRSRLTSLPSVRALVAGQQLRLTGQLSQASNRAAATGRTVQLSFRPDLGPAFSRAVKTNAKGAWTYTLRPSYNLTVAAGFAGDARYLPAAAAGSRIGVGAAISRTVTAVTSSRDPLVVTGTVSPTKTGRVIGLYRVTSKGSVLIGRATIARDGRYRVATRLGPGRWVLRTHLTSSPGNIASSSPLVAVRRT